MIPYGLTREQFVKRYRRWLDKATAKLIAELRALFAAPVPQTVLSADVQIFLGDDGREGPRVWVYFDGLNKKVDNRDTSIFPGRALEIQLGLGAPPDFDEMYFESDEFPAVNLQANALKAWFAECWWKAGGWTYALPAEVSVHNDFADGERIHLTER